MSFSSFDEILDHLDDLVPGDKLDIVNLDQDEKNEILDEIMNRGLVLEDDIVGEIDNCLHCGGEGIEPGKEEACRSCDGACTVVDFGRGKRPYYG